MERKFVEVGGKVYKMLLAQGWSVFDVSSCGTAEMHKYEEDFFGGQ